MSLCCCSVLRKDTKLINAFAAPSDMWYSSFSETMRVRAILQWFEVRKWWQV